MTTLFKRIICSSTSMRKLLPLPRAIALASATVAFLAASITAAHETQTHDLLTRLAVSKSKLKLDSSLVADYGFPSADATNADYQLSWGQSAATVRTLHDAVAAGAVWEDNHYDTRAFNHFFDPQADKMSGRALTVFGATLGNTSPNWILEDWGTVIHVTQTQEFSFRRGQEALYASLASEYPATRFAAFSKVLQTLGHVVHHIQDMSQPQHVRNDQHVHPVPVVGSNPDWSFYELWTLNEMQQGRIGPVASQAYPVPVFPTARQFWYTPTTDSTEYFAGMAEFTSKNFVSYGTPYRSSMSGAPQVIGATEYPLPNGFNRDGTAKTFGGSVVEQVQLPDGSWVSGEVEYLYGKVYDGYTNAITSANIKLGTATLVSSFLAAKALPYRSLRFAENTATYRDGQKILLPRAVAFSAGLIDHFFRGRLDLKQGSGDNWVIENRSGQAMNGEFSVYAEGTDGRRMLVPNTTRQAWVGAGQTLTLTFRPADTTKNLVGVFRGRIGEEGDSTLASGFYAVAGRVVPYVAPVLTPPLTPCSQSLFTGGGQAGYNNSVELGGSSGTVTVDFQAYTITDSLEIKTPNGKVVSTTNGFVSGRTLSSFQHNPDNGKYVNVSVVGNQTDAKTAWTLSVSCPNQTTPPPPTVSVTWGVDIPAPVTSNGITKYACRGTWTFGQPGYFRNSVGGRYELTEGKSYQFTLLYSDSNYYASGCLPTKPYYIDAVGKHFATAGTGFIMVQSYGGGGGG